MDIKAIKRQESNREETLSKLRVKSTLYKKTYHDFNNLSLQQTIKLQNSDSTIWVVKFRRDGRFMATGGKDCILRIWQLQTTELYQAQVN
mmetsp:Transcript_34675/g.53133  ORF Transcript_34675/g.53133 Transcript_34675/m.53133 type:complete len:90 (+) Transcript_34675:981-1250(+)